MNLLEFVRDEAPKRCGVLPIYGEIAATLLQMERLGLPVFDAQKYPTTRDRAAVLLPYNPVDIDGYEWCLDVLEHYFEEHYAQFHRDRHDAKRMAELSATASGVITAAWWSA